ncbi:MAG: dipicolinate synthase subunit B [Christensenellaceae bacterium]|jgi:dipicolinate synthase subunit B|nr:dipicolinate synthase subunit B [Christensenellaceae bacterium]
MHEKIGFALTGSHCTLEETLPLMRELIGRGYGLVPILSPAVAGTDTRFGSAAHWKEALAQITDAEPILTIAQAEPIGPKKLLDAIVVAPCTGNTLAKLANGISDGPVLMAIKAQLRNERPVILAVSTNDGLSGNAQNLGRLLVRRHIYFVPFGQDDPKGKPASLIAKMELIPETLEAALQGRQFQPLLAK